VQPLDNPSPLCYNVTMKTSTIYQKSIKDPSEFDTLKKGSSNKKLGFKITTKKWKGKRLYSLTLTERETCPTSCHHWDDCYGNNMPFAHRFSTNGLTDQLKVEIDYLMRKHKQGIVIRLHVLGDFYSLEYVNFWQDMMLEYPELCIFGYTGRLLSTDIGAAIHLLNLRFSDRFVVRYSRNNDTEALGKWFAAEEGFEGKYFDCPEQSGKVANCASCGLCWMAPKTVRFTTH
jgi:hypothetical protein